MIGQTLSHYKILEKLGSGGMGEVYVAEDTKLHRNVALKILPPEMASEERRHRFEREAQTIAALNHPNIVHVYSVEEDEGVHFITMELVKGKTLTELIPKKGLPLSKFFEIAIPLSDAVSAAHQQGITHRDLKPDNLMVSDEGRLKILDFGLAKLKQEFAQEGISELPTQSATQEGRILGTVAYMSPEQAEGKSIDHRTDIFSIGIILYEMATGERPFKGSTAASLLSSILKDTPSSVTSLNPKIPSILARIIKRCLVKDTEHRYQTAKDLRNELEELKQEVQSGEVPEGARRPTIRRMWLWISATVVLVVLAGVVIYLLPLVDVVDKGITPPVLGTFRQLTSQAGEERFPSLSPDGEVFVYARKASGNWDIYRQRVGGETAFNLTEDCTAHDIQPAFSPDGERIVFRSDREGGGIFLMEATGESVRRLTDEGYNPAWSPDGNHIVYATASIWTWLRFERSQLWKLDVRSGKKRLLTTMDAVQPSWSPKGHRIAYWSIQSADGRTTGRRDIWSVPDEGGGAIPVTDTSDTHTDWNPVWSPNGEYLYFISDRGANMNLWRVRIDEKLGKPLSPPEAVTSGVSAACHYLSFSRDGNRVAYAETTQMRNIWRIRFDAYAEKAEGDPELVTRGTWREYAPQCSPDGEWLAYVSAEN